MRLKLLKKEDKMNLMIKGSEINNKIVPQAKVVIFKIDLFLTKIILLRI